MEKGEAEIDALKRVCGESKQKGKITGEHLTRLTAVFGSRFLKAWEAVRDGRVKKYTFKPSGRVVWIVVGRKRDYLVMPAADFCSCDDFYYNVMERKAHLCYHLIAQKLAESLVWYDKIDEGDDFFDILMKEWKKVTP
jgi:predicted nucleic acid-binding Zn finger protein